MGLFSKTREPSPNERPLRPIAMDATVLQEVDLRLRAIEDAMGTSDARIRGAIKALAVSAGAVEPEDLMRRGLNPKEAQRPWRWLARAAEHAQAAGDDMLPARVLLFTSWWTDMQPQMGLADYFDMLMDVLPPDVRGEIMATGIASLRRLPAETILITQAPNSPTAGVLLAALGDAGSR